MGIGEDGSAAYTLQAAHCHAVAFISKDSGNDVAIKHTPTICNQHRGIAVAQQMQVRRLTPLECERLQGFPDNYTNIPGASDSARYKALGNSMAVNVMQLIGEIRDRLYWVADSEGDGHERSRRFGQSAGRSCIAHGGSTGGMAYAQRDKEHQEQQRPPENEGGGRSDFPGRCYMADTDAATSPTNGFWRDADWLFCRDGNGAPVEPGTFPLAHGAPARVGRLRGYGNAINAAAAQAFIEGYMTCSL